MRKTIHVEHLHFGDSFNKDGLLLIVTNQLHAWSRHFAREERRCTTCGRGASIRWTGVEMTSFAWKRALCLLVVNEKIGWWIVQ